MPMMGAKILYSASGSTSIDPSGATHPGGVARATLARTVGGATDVWAHASNAAPETGAKSRLTRAMLQALKAAGNTPARRTREVSDTFSQSDVSLTGGESKCER